MRSLICTAVLAGVFGPLATTAFAADLEDYPPPPAPYYYEPRPVPPAFVPERVPPVYYRAPVVLPRRVIYPRPYPYYRQRPVVRVYEERGVYGRPYADGPYRGPGYARGYPHEAELDRREGGIGREGYGHEGYGHEGYGHEGRGFERDGRDDDRREHDQRYGHYLSHEEMERRADREHGYDDRFADRNAPRRDFDRQ